jgi:hypothetical protein
MTALAGERGGVVTKLLAILLVLGIIATAALYIYGKRQQPLSADGVHVATSDGGRQPATVGIAPGRSVYVATIIRNDGPLEVTIDGLAPAPGSPTDVYVPVSIALGDGKQPQATGGAFVPPSLAPHTGVGVVITYTLNPDLACARFTDAPSEPAPLPPVPFRLSSYGVDTTQSLLLPGPPMVAGITRTACERALP